MSREFRDRRGAQSLPHRRRHPGHRRHPARGSGPTEDLVTGIGQRERHVRGPDSREPLGRRFAAGLSQRPTRIGSSVNLARSLRTW